MEIYKNVLEWYVNVNAEFHILSLYTEIYGRCQAREGGQVTLLRLISSRWRSVFYVDDYISIKGDTGIRADISNDSYIL
jgi:hypothetical protein